MFKHFFVIGIALLAVLILSVESVYAQKYTIQNYIKEHTEIAQNLMIETGVPASVILAVAIHESAYGNSRVAKHLNNHFGIKGKNSSKVIRSAYKGYDTVLDSYHDFVGLLKRRKRTKKLFEEFANNEYKNWVLGIAKSGYSTTGDWSRKVINTIHRYNLGQFDETAELLAKKIFPCIPSLPEVNKQDIFKMLSPRYYTVQPNDTLEEIAFAFDVSIEQIMKENAIQKEELEIGLGLRIG